MEHEGTRFHVRLFLVAACAALLAFTHGTWAATWHVAANGIDSADGTTWGSAKATIQAAIDLAASNDTVLVSNGVYSTGGRVVYGAMINRVAITNAVTVRSVNGPEVTVVAGNGPPGDGAVRCVYVGANCALEGFTLTEGATRENGDFDREQSGGGAWCEPSGLVSNCNLTGNRALLDGGGSHYGTLYNCTLSDNSAGLFGGGASSGTLYNCTLTGNQGGYGGGTFGCTLYNSVLASNSADNGGGACNATLYNCTLANNSAQDGGGCAWGCELYNCIVYFNGAPTDENYDTPSLSYCCTTPDPGGTGNITNEPQFVDAASGNYRLKAAFPGVDEGNNAFARGTIDRDGNPRIVHGTVDMGAYEFQYNAGYWSWAHNITNGLTNLDQCATGDGYPNLLKYATGSSPMNSDDLARVSGGLSNGLFSVFNRNTNAVDVTLIIEGTDAVTNNAQWNGIATNSNGLWGGATNVVETGTTNPLVVTVQDSGAAPNRFLRLRVTRP